jgi:DNA replicative helicase MCM subunit Mcm2 (Cdc46/Mcm family)
MKQDYSFPLVNGSAGTDALLHVLDQPSTTPVTAGKGGKSDSALQSTLEFFKVDASEIATITSVVGTVTSMASIVGFSISAVSTVKDCWTSWGSSRSPRTRR